MTGGQLKKRKVVNKYLKTKDFEKAGVMVQFHQFEHPVYSQRYGEFTPNISIVDLFFNEGSWSKEFFTR